MSMITDAGALTELAEQMASLPVFGLDTEFLRERTYYAQLCLLQLGLPGRELCVDTIVLPDLAPLAGCLASTTVPKIMHAARQDLEVLWRASGPVRNVYDTQVAASLTGFPAQVGYGALVEQLFGVKLDKSATRTDWSRRPLSPQQLEYALDDVRHLLPLRELLNAKLAELGRTPWFAEEMAELDLVTSYEIAPEDAWKRLKGLGGLDEWRLSLAAALGAWRERRAMHSDVPRSWILADVPLREMVLRVPRTPAQLAQIPEMPEGVARNSGQELLALVESLQPPAVLPPLPQRERPDETQQALVRKLSQLARRIANDLQLAPEILATRRDLEQIAGGALNAAPLSGWRREIVGQQLLAGI
jgi:ribonuclease D